MQTRTWILAAVIALGMAGLAPSAGAVVEDEQRETYVAAGGHLALEYPSDPLTIVDEGRALGATTCTEAPLGPVEGPPGGPPLVPEPPLPVLGGACFGLADYPDDAVVTVQVTRNTVTVPENVVSFAAGYDLDDDNCVGCSPADALWRANGALTIPVLEEADSLAIFVYTASADNEPIGPGGPVSVVTGGEITVSQVGTSDLTCEQKAGAPEDRCGLSLAQPRPHLCVPDCTPPPTVQ